MSQNNKWAYYIVLKVAAAVIVVEQGYERGLSRAGRFESKQQVGVLYSAESSSSSFSVSINVSVLIVIIVVIKLPV